jgi:hypothetical protein
LSFGERVWHGIPLSIIEAGWIEPDIVACAR